MKMAFLVICPGPFQYTGVRERWGVGLGRKRERERLRERRKNYN